MYELRSHPKKKPILVDSYELAKVFDELCKKYFKKEILITPEVIPDEFDMDLYETLYLNNTLKVFDKISFHPDVVILGMDLANFESVDYKELLEPYIASNEKLVAQFKEGNDKALNALMGKFLKENKGHDAKIIKETLEEMLKA